MLELMIEILCKLILEHGDNMTSSMLELNVTVDDMVHFVFDTVMAH